MSDLCPLSGAKRTCAKRLAMSANDPKQTSVGDSRTLLSGLLSFAILVQRVWLIHNERNAVSALIRLTAPILGGVAEPAMATGHI